MLSIEQLRKIDPEMAHVSNEELEEIRRALYETGQVLFDIWWYKKSGSKNPTGLLLNQNINETI